MINKKYHTINAKGWCHIQKSCIVISKHNLNKSTHISLTFKLKTLNNLNSKCSQPNDYTNKITNTNFFLNNYVLNFKDNQLKIIMNGSISIRVLN
jgi:hypothetical protein